MQTEATHRSQSGIEQHSIDYIPAAERHGSVRAQGPFWFTGNFNFLTVAMGFIGPSVGLSFFWTAIATILGMAFGTLFMAFHASQGPVLGLPQMIQSRAQFGYRGVLLPLVASLLNFAIIGSVSALLISGGLHSLFGWNQGAILAVLAALSLVFAAFGYDLLHRIFIILFWVSLPLFGIFTVAVLFGGVPHTAPHAAPWTLVGFGLQFAACASYQIAYAPYVSDYTRYLPAKTGAASIIANVFAGAALSGIWLAVLGAWLATRLGASDPLVSINSAGGGIYPRFGALLVLDSVLLMAASLAMTSYSGMLTLITMADSVRKTVKSRQTRLVAVILFIALWLLIAAIFGQSAMTALNIGFTVILYTLIPWSSVNLVDYFFIHKGHYNVAEMFKPRGIYGAWRWKGLFSYAAGLLATIPFAVLPGYWTGPVANKIGGVDIGWLAGLVVASSVYYLLSRGTRLAPQELHAVAPLGLADGS